MQESIVTIIVVYAFWVIAKRYAPQSVQQFFRSGMARIAKRFGWIALASKFETKTQAAASCGDGCGTCGDCSANKVPIAAKQFTISPGAIKRSDRML